MGGEFTSSRPDHYTRLLLLAATMALEAKHIIVRGRVQGVGFRYFVQHIGSLMGLAGNVRNCEDGTVEIMVEGPGRRIGEFIKEIQKGPPLARVERLEIHDIPVYGEYLSFQIEGW